MHKTNIFHDNLLFDSEDVYLSQNWLKLFFSHHMKIIIDKYKSHEWF